MSASTARTDLAFVYLCGGIRGEYCLRALLEAGERIVGVVGHAGTLDSPIARLARDSGLNYEAPSDPNAPEFLDLMSVTGCELAVMSGYNRILRQAFLERFPRGVINLHGGPLPHYRGGSPLNWQIIRGEPRIGISVLFTDAGIDTGPVLACDEFELEASETIDSVVQRSLPRFARLLLGVLDGLRRGSLEPRPQDRSAAVYFAKRLPEDGWIDWRSRSAEQVHNLVRALAGSYPGAFSYCRKLRLVIEETRILEETIIAPPGRVLARRPEGVEVAAADRALLVRKVRDAQGLVLPAAHCLPPRNTYFDCYPAESKDIAPDEIH